jgi:Tol biopolymer transport system component
MTYAGAMLRRCALLAVTAALGAGVWASAAVGAGPGSTTLVSIPTGFVAPFDGVNSSLGASARAVSADGRFVVFSSRADGLSSGQADDAGLHCYRRDLTTGTTALVDRATGVQGAVGNSGCSDPTISPDGSAVAFTAGSTNLVPGDTNNISDIFVRMVGAGVTYRANVDVNGAQSTGSVFGAAITTTPAVNRVNGPTVYVALATNGSLDPAHDPDAPPGIFDVYLRRSQPLSILAIAPSSTTLISRATGANTNAANGGDPSISADGTKVAFTTTSNLDAADTGNDRDVYLRDVTANTTTLVSRPDGLVGQADGSSFASEISNDGGSVVFDSNASNMDDDSGPDVNGVPGRDIYIRRLAANETVTASLVSGSLTQRGTGESLNASISSDGNRVAFLTTSANLGDGDTDTTADIHVRDLTTNVTTWASRADGAAGGPTGAGGRDAAISGDGAAVLFDGPARGVAPGAGGDAGQVFLRTLAAGTTRLVSRPTGPDTAPFAQLVSYSFLTQADFDDNDNDPLARRVTSADGRFVVFASESDGMLGGLGAQGRQILLRDMVAGTTRLVSHDASGAPGTDDSGQPTISADGSVVAFTTHAPNLGAVTNAQVDVWRAATDSVSIASATPAGAAGNGLSYSASLSTDGTKVAFESQATNLGETPAPGVLVNAWWRDLTTGTTRLASRADGAAGAPADGASFRPAISGDGSRVGFATVATNLGNGDASATLDVHVRDITAGTTQWASRVDGPGGVGANGNSLYPSLDADGGVVAFESVATNLTDDDTDAVPDIFTRDLGSGRTTLISRASGAAGDKGTKSSVTPLISGDGRRVAFESLAPNLVPDDPNTLDDVFVRDLTARTTVGVSRVDGAGGTLLGLDDHTAFGASPDLHCVAFESDRPAFVGGGYSSPDFTQIYLRTVSGDCAANAAVPGAGSGGAGRVKLTKVSLRPRAFRPRAHGRGGAILRFTLSEKAPVKVTVQRPLVGHRRGKRCAIRFRTGKRCTVWKAVGSFTIAGKAGANRRVFTAKLRRRTLAPGRYRLFLVVTKAGKRVSTPRTVRFRIKPPPAR